PASDAVTGGGPSRGRLGSASARVPAQVMTVLPLRVAATADETVEARVRDTAGALVRGRRHGRYRGDQIRRDLGWSG
ncbi:hypothetical protein, partial [Stenotrophomonas sp. SrG]|uniref:hypothetical protein n=1 Tax=Stenotrophomonas sp. SrG TaxID=3414430 RepID=UPI003CF422B6